jgi:hypothetical protein
VFPRVIHNGAVKPRWVVCEDGNEYLERFTRFLDEDFEFVPAADGAALLAAVSPGTAGVILDLDFRRTPADHLVDEHGLSHVALSDGARRRLAETQGILLLRLLRRHHLTLPVLLFADLEDPAQSAYLEKTLSPVIIVPSHEGLAETAQRMRGVGTLSLS